MLALGGLGLCLLAGVVWPGALIAGVLFAYPIGALSGYSWAAEAFSVGAVVAASWFLFRNRASIALCGVDASVFLAVSWFCLSAIYSASPVAEGEAYWLVLRVIPIYVLGRLIGATGPIRSVVLQAAVGLAALGLLVSGLTLVSGGASALGALGRVDQGTVARAVRLTVGDANPVGLSKPLPFALLAGLALLVAVQVKWKWTLRVVGVVAISGVLYGSIGNGTRGLFVAFFAGLAAFLIFLAQAYRRRVMVTLCGLLAMMVIALPTALSYSTVATLAFRRLTMNFGDDGLVLDTSVGERFLAFREALRLFADHPLVGIGIDGFRATTGIPYPHNLFLEVATQYGLVGLSLLGALMAALVAMIWRSGLRSVGWEGPLLLGWLVAGFAHQQISSQIGNALGLFIMVGVSTSAASRLLREGARQDAFDGRSGAGVVDRSPRRGGPRLRRLEGRRGGGDPSFAQR